MSSSGKQKAIWKKSQTHLEQEQSVLIAIVQVTLERSARVYSCVITAKDIFIVDKTAVCM